MDLELITGGVFSLVALYDKEGRELAQPVVLARVEFTQIGDLLMGRHGKGNMVPVKVETMDMLMSSQGPVLRVEGSYPDSGGKQVFFLFPPNDKPVDADALPREGIDSTGR